MKEVAVSYVLILKISLFQNNMKKETCSFLLFSQNLYPLSFFVSTLLHSLALVGRSIRYLRHDFLLTTISKSITIYRSRNCYSYRLHVALVPVGAKSSALVACGWSGVFLPRPLSGKQGVSST